MTTFEDGAKVRRNSNPGAEYEVLGSGASVLYPEDRGEQVALRRTNGPDAGYLTIVNARRLEPVPDTVTLTIEATREDLLNFVGDANVLGKSSYRPVDLLVDAAREALF